ncbi:MAG: sulfotransferase domain-containing protein [Planctomycetales bacterium]|nr:sulfotransferase domain-containing protein [Planctomycetales bacterium]
MSQHLPNFMIIGASKCGTTSLWTYLDRHPDVFLTRIKEPMFFNMDRYYERGVNWYQQLFAEAGDAKLRGEATTSYTYAPHIPDVPKRIHDLVPDCKFIYMVRPPVARTYSHYVQELQVRVFAPEGDLGTFEEAIEKCPMLVDAGMYIKQLERFERYFSRDQIKVIFAKDLRQNPNAVLSDIQEFLGLSHADLTVNSPVTANTQGSHHARQQLNEKLEKVKSIPGVHLLTRVIPKQTRANLYNRFVSSKRLRKIADLELDVKPALAQTNEDLRALFKEANEMLGDYLGCDLSDWDRPRTKTA